MAHGFRFGVYGEVCEGQNPVGNLPVAEGVGCAAEGVELRVWGVWLRVSGVWSRV
jgi:hypothetical protein